MLTTFVTGQTILGDGVAGEKLGGPTPTSGEGGGASASTIHFLDVESGQRTEIYRSEEPFWHGGLKVSPDEIQIIACGTGMPAARRGQAASCWLFELGNGDRFIFDLGTRSMANVMALMIPANYLTRVFARSTALP